MSLPWAEPGWLTAVSEWVEQAAHVSGRVTELHRRPWSAMLRVPTVEGMLWFKASAPGLAHEAPLTELLAELHPDCTPGLVAVDHARGWLLMRDSGETVRAQLQARPDPALLAPVLDRYARLQRSMAPRAEQLLAMQVPDRRLATLVDLADVLPVDQDLVAELAATVESVPLPDTLVHEEIHDANVLLRDGAPVYIDWADSCVGHPFFGVVVGLRSASDRLHLDPGAPELEHLLDVYLERWADLAPYAELRRVFPAAYRLGMLNRALTWHRDMLDLDGPARHEHEEYVSAWVQEFTEAVDPRPGT